MGLVNELQVFNMSRYHVYHSIPRDDLYDRKHMFKIHKYLLNNKTDNKILVSVRKRGILKQIRHFCIKNNFYNNFYIYKRTINETLHLNKDAFIEYMYNEEHIW